MRDLHVMKPASSLSASGVHCHVCVDSIVVLVPGYEGFYRVTSDCKPWDKGGHLYVCRTCGCVQKVADYTLEEQIYEAYSIYHQSDGVEQTVFDEVTGQPASRSARLLDHLLAHVRLPSTGRLLDIGCGNGALLQSFSRLAPSWLLTATELNDKYRAVVENIDRVEALYTCTPDLIPGTFHLITMIHVLEHISEPKDFLMRLWDKLELGGVLVVQTPDYLQNPFDLLIADHCTHFTGTTATQLVQDVGYEVTFVTTDWIPKELTLIARKTKGHQNHPIRSSSVQGFDSPLRSLRWLESIVATAREISTRGTFGLFGTSIAATWLFSELNGMVNFFVDEDPHRMGKTYMGRPIFHPREVPKDGHVFVVLPTRLAENVRARMAGLNLAFKCYLPPCC